MNISKLTHKQKKIAIGVGISVIAIGFLLYSRSKNKKEASAILDYISKMPSQVDLSSATDSGMNLVRDTKIDLSKIKIDNLSGAYKNKDIRNAISKVVVELYASMKGVGTNRTQLLNSLNRVKNKNTLAFIDRVYKAMYKEGLFEAMASESLLNNKAFNLFSDKTKYEVFYKPTFMLDSKWAPEFAPYFNNLPIY